MMEVRPRIPSRLVALHVLWISSLLVDAERRDHGAQPSSCHGAQPS
jgi:hypothetical protein